MGQQHSISTTIEIASPPDTVRAVVGSIFPASLSVHDRMLNVTQFLDWKNYKTWNPNWELTPLEPVDRLPTDLQPGDKMKVDMRGTVFRPVVVVSCFSSSTRPLVIHFQPAAHILGGNTLSNGCQENTTNAFKWLGSLYGLFDGQHEFYWKKSDVTPGGTTLVQKEDFTGPLTWFVREGSSGGLQTRGNFEGFNRELKKAAEDRTAK